MEFGAAVLDEKLAEGFVEGVAIVRGVYNAKLGAAACAAACSTEVLTAVVLDG